MFRNYFFTFLYLSPFPFFPFSSHTIYTNMKSHNGGFWKTCTKYVAALSKVRPQVRYIWNALYTGGRRAVLKRGKVDLRGKERNGVREEPVRLPSFLSLYFAVSFHLPPFYLSRSFSLSLSLSLSRNTFLFTLSFFSSPISFPAQYTERPHGRTLIVGSRHQHT